jgi:hypothetical protein
MNPICGHEGEYRPVALDPTNPAFLFDLSGCFLAAPAPVIPLLVLHLTIQVMIMCRAPIKALELRSGLKNFSFVPIFLERGKGGGMARPGGDQHKPEPHQEPDDRLVSVDGDPESLDVLIHIVKTGLEEIRQSYSYIAIGEALTKIRDGKLYRETHKTFEAFTLERFGLARSSAYEYIDAAAEARENVRSSGHSPPSINAALKQKKKRRAATLDQAFSEVAGRLLPSPRPQEQARPEMTDDERAILESRQHMRKGVERVAQNRKTDILVHSLAEELWLTGEREPITITPTKPIFDLSGQKAEPEQEPNPEPAQADLVDTFGERFNAARWRSHEKFMRS